MVTETVDDVVGTVTETVDDAIGTVTAPVDDLIGTVTDTVDGAIGTVTDTVGTVTDAVTNTVGGVTDTVGGVVGTVTDTVGGVGDVGESSPPPPAITSDPILEPAASTSRRAPPHGSPAVISALQHDPPNIVLPIDVHPASVGATSPDVAGREPGPVLPRGLPSPLDAAAAALRTLHEAGGTSLLWAFLALLVLLPSMDDRWLRFVRALQRPAPLLASNGRPG
jgi:hypothetical protein